MTDSISIPWDRLREFSHEWNLAGASVSSGKTASGFMPASRSDGGGLWTAFLNESPLRSKQDVLLWRAIRTLADGGATPIVVPRRELLTQPWPVVDGREVKSLVVPHSDGSLFSDGSGYYQSVIEIFTLDDVALRATSMRVRLDIASALQGGEVFSVFHETAPGWRMYEIGTAFADDADPSVTTITFRPPLRDDINEGTCLEFDRPRCTMQLENPDAMNLSLKAYPFGRPSARYVEAPWVDVD